MTHRRLYFTIKLMVVVIVVVVVVVLVVVVIVGRYIRNMVVFCVGKKLQKSSCKSR